MKTILALLAVTVPALAVGTLSTAAPFLVLLLLGLLTFNDILLLILLVLVLGVIA